jgi:glyoxylase-like metal-dependent hydrolase (beta-lactamase superfamily II)
MKLINNLYRYPEKGIMDCNTYLFDADTSVLVDPGSPFYSTYLIGDICRDGINPSNIDVIINTHLHPDHSGANRSFMRRYGTKLKAYEGVGKWGGYSFPSLALSEIEGVLAGSVMVSGYFGDELKLNDIMLEIIPTPGHSPESISIYWRDEEVLICGDVVFSPGMGRVGFPGGDAMALKQSIEKISELEIEYLLPGHGEIIRGKENVKRTFEIVKSWL